VPPTPATHCENVLAELQAKAPGLQGPARRVAAADAMGELEATVAVMVLDTGNFVGGDVRDDVVFEKVSSCEGEVSDIMGTDVVFVKVGNCVVEANDGGGIDVVLADVALAKTTGNEEAVGGTTLEVGNVSVVMTAEEIRVVLQEDVEEAVGVSDVVAVIFTTCRRREEDGVRPIIVATVAKSVSTTVDVDSDMIVDAEVLGSKSEYVDVDTLANGSGVGVVGDIVVLEAVLFGALPMPVNPIPGLGG
jgi:hypothetical protein